MNWVGGSRNRYMNKKDDTMKLRAFFQKQKMKRKSNYTDFTKEQNSGNMDMLSLFIVNRMSAKKEQTDKGKNNHLIGAKRTKKDLNEPLKFAMSPCPPSNLNLVSSQPKYNVGASGFKTRKHRISEGFKPLSPVLESNLSDAGSSENQEQPSSTYAGSLVPVPVQVQVKPAPHPPSSIPSTESHDHRKNAPQLASVWTDVSTQDAPQNKSESTLPLPEISEHSATSVLYPTSHLKSSDQSEEPLFLDFKNIDYEVLASLNSSVSSSQNMDNENQFSPQDFFCTDSKTSFNGSGVTVNLCESSRGVHFNFDNIKAQRHDGNPPITLDTGTQTATLSYRDVSVQCSLIQHSDSVSFPAAHVLTTGQHVFYFNQSSVTALGSLKDGHTSIGNRPATSATKQVAQRYPNLQPGISFVKLRQMRVNGNLTSTFKHPSQQASEQNKDQRWESTVEIEKCAALNWKM